MSLRVRRALHASVFVCLIASSAPAVAQDGVIQIPVIVVTPDRTPVAADRIGSTISIVSREMLEEGSGGSLTDALKRVPGVTVTESGGPGSRAVVSLRGAEPQHTLVLIDGIRVNDAASARDEFDFATIAITDIERIEILRGPQSAVYGSDAMGGVINIITRPADGTRRFVSTTEAGSYGTIRETATAAGRIGRLNLTGTLTGFRTRGFSRVGDRDTDEPDGAAKLAGSLRGSADLSDRLRFDFGFDGYGLAADYDKSPTSPWAGGPGNAPDTAQRRLLSAFARLSGDALDGRMRNQATVFATRNDRIFDEARAGGTTRTTTYRSTDIGAEGQTEFDVFSGGTLLLGGRVEQEAAFQQQGGAAAPAFDSTRLLYAVNALQRTDIGERLHLSFAGRFDGMVAGPGFLTGRLSAAYELFETDTILRASLGTGAKRPTAFQLSYNPALAIERGIGGDAGIEQRLLGGRATLTATAFANRFTDLIDFTGDFATGTYRNISAARTAGLEVTATAGILPGVLEGSASYTWLGAVNLASGLPLPRRAAHSGSASLTYVGLPRLRTTLSATVVGVRFNDDAATQRLDPYLRLDLFASYEVNASLTLFGRVENILNSRYQEISGYNSAGLSAYAGLRWQH